VLRLRNSFILDDPSLSQFEIIITNIETEMTTNDTDAINLFEESNNFHINVSVNWF